MGENIEQPEAADEALRSSSTVGRKRDRTRIEFPYSDMERAVELANTLHTEGGQARIDTTQLAVALNMSAAGGTFRGRLSAAKLFGLVDSEQGLVWLTERGLQIIHPPTAAAARSEAFLAVPLYREMFHRYNGYALPPPAAIERHIETLGVPPKQKERARQVFSASATFAGYISANGRFSRPVAAAPEPDPAKPEGEEHGGGGSGGGGGSDDQNRRKPLEYELVDLLKDEAVADEHREAIWTLVRFLAEKKKDAAAAQKILE